MGVKWLEVPHLFLICFFIDDNFFFFHVGKEECDVLKNCLQVYEKASGQCINFEKSLISFNTNTSDECREEVCDILGVVSTTDHGLYLVLPSLVGRNKRKDFSFIKDKVQHRLRN